MIKHLALCLALSFPALPAAATNQDEIVRADILPGWRGRDGTHMAALRLRLAPEWKTYWRSPGDAGIPPLFDWTGSENVAALKVHWPRPHVFLLNGMRTIGYREQVVLPLEITARDPSRPIRLRATVDLGVCRDICVPAAVRLSADLPASGSRDVLIGEALERRPSTPREAGVARVACRVEPIEDGLRLTAELDMPATGGSEVVVLEPGEASVWVGDSVSTRQGNRLTATTEMVAPDGQPFALDRSAVTVTVLGADRAVEIRGCPAP